MRFWLRPGSVCLLAVLLGVAGPTSGRAEPQAQVTRREYIETFLTMLGESPYQVRRDAAWALGGLGPTASPAATSLVARLSDRRAPVRQQAARALVQLGEGAVEPVRKALFSENVRTRWLAARVLGSLGIGDERVRERLRELSLSESEDRRVRRTAWWARSRLLRNDGRGD